jgi:hypothetical protein
MKLNKENHYKKIKSIINSCILKKQLKSCIKLNIIFYKIYKDYKLRESLRINIYNKLKELT